MQPKNMVTSGNITTVSGSGTAITIASQQTTTTATSAAVVASVVPVTENSEEVSYFPRVTKKLTVQGTNTTSPSNMGDTVNVVFRAPVVSSSSNQSMRPPPPPPPKIKGHPEEPSSSIPDLGKCNSFFF